MLVFYKDVISWRIFFLCKIGAIAERNINFSFIQSCKFFHPSQTKKINWKVQTCYIWNTFYHLYIAIIDHDRLIHYIITQFVLLSPYNTWRDLYIFLYVYIAVFANFNILVQLYFYFRKIQKWP